MGGVQSAVISGATDASGREMIINGIYDKVDERCGGHRLYVKRGDANMCLEHYEEKWKVKPMSYKGKDGCIAYVEGGCKLKACTSRVWRVYEATGQRTGFHDAPNVKLVTGAEAQRQVRGGCLRARQHAPLSPNPPSLFELALVLRDVSLRFAQISDQATAVAAENARAVPVFISGATGDKAAFVNGFFEPTQEKGPDGRVMYSKRGDVDVISCIRHHKGAWEVQLVPIEPDNRADYYVEGGCALEDCASRVWKMVDEQGVLFNDTPSVKLVTGAEAQRQVRGGCLRARQHAPLSPTSHRPPSFLV
jgi:hypothetical protein